uniref:Uncharacterized protein n=1 Tax=uncultured marine group II/III euryarchaeote KM3_51_D01 TaxID=1456454 RepID=A0A075H861_9EURY|nr:hypothetical protein [uncultured marine group II/III euryarchaeote KM3_51_D01]
MNSVFDHLEDYLRNSSNTQRIPQTQYEKLIAFVLLSRKYVDESSHVYRFLLEGDGEKLLVVLRSSERHLFHGAHERARYNLLKKLVRRHSYRLIVLQELLLNSDFIDILSGFPENPTKKERHKIMKGELFDYVSAFFEHVASEIHNPSYKDIHIAKDVGQSISWIISETYPFLNDLYSEFGDELESLRGQEFKNIDFHSRS